MNTIHELGCFDLNYETGEGYWSPEFTSIMGLPSDHAGDYETFLKCIHPEDRRAVAAARERGFRSEDAPGEHLELRVCGAWGRCRWVELMTQTFGHGSLFGPTECVLGFVADVTEGKKCHVCAGHPFGAAPLRFGAFEANFQTGEECWTPEMSAIFGLPAGEKGGFEVVFKRVHPDDRRAVIAAAMSGMRPDSPRISAKHRIIRDDGGVRWVQMAGRTLFDPETPCHAVSFVGIVADITNDETLRMEAASALPTLRAPLIERARVEKQITASSKSGGKSMVFPVGAENPSRFPREAGADSAF